MAYQMSIEDLHESISLLQFSDSPVDISNCIEIIDTYYNNNIFIIIITIIIVVVVIAVIINLIILHN